MNRDQFLSELRAALKGLRPQETDDIITDYAAYFAEAQAAGRSEQEVASALGDPRRLARELRAEAGLKRWENRRTPGNFVGAVIALCGLAAVDLLILLPLLCILGLIAFATGVALFAIVVVGIGLLTTPFWGLTFGDWQGVASIMLAGIGLIAGGVGWGAVLLLLMEGFLILLGKYARLHYRLTKPAGDPA